MEIRYFQHSKTLASSWDIFITKDSVLIHIGGHHMHPEMGHYNEYSEWPKEKWFQTRFKGAKIMNEIPLDILFSLMVRDIVVDSELQQAYKTEYF